jgi:hypothetical protein
VLHSKGHIISSLLEMLTVLGQSMGVILVGWLSAGVSEVWCIWTRLCGHGNLLFLMVDFINTKSTSIANVKTHQMFALAKSLGNVKIKVTDHGKSLPEGAAEHEDYEVWGRKFMKRLVSIFAVVVRCWHSDPL